LINFFTSVHTSIILSCLYIGANSVIATYHLVLFFIAREKAHFYIAIALVSVTVLIADVQGILYQYGWPEHIDLREITNPIGWGMGIALIALFFLSTTELMAKGMNFNRQARLLGQHISLREQNKFQSRCDCTTGSQLLNHENFEQRVQQALLSLNAGGSLQHALLICDLDRFKIINDVSGHFAGDECLRQITDFLCKHIGPGDCVARIGGDAFAVLLSNRNETEAIAIAEGIRTDLEQYDFIWRGKHFKTMGSIGVIALTAKMVSIDMALSLAHAACYAAKEMGRNRTMLGSDVQLAARRQLSQSV
jgi:diguanylate cyclase (GGDEF)-like protein